MLRPYKNVPAPSRLNKNCIELKFAKTIEQSLTILKKNSFYFMKIFLFVEGG